MAASAIRCARRTVMHNLCERAWHQNLCPQRASCGTFPVLSAGKIPKFLQRGQRLLGKPWSSLPSWKYLVFIQIQLQEKKNRSSWKRGEIPPTWNEWQSHMLALRRPFPQQCPLRFCTLTHCQKPLKYIKWEEQKFMSRVFPSCWQTSQNNNRNYLQNVNSFANI